MAKRSREGVADDLFAIALKLPWWVGIGIAVVSYLVLHAYATADLPQATSAADIGRVASHGLFRTLVAMGQFILPLIFTVGAVMALIKQRKVIKLVDDVAASKSVDALTNMSWQEFELLVGESFRRQGYRVTQIGGDGPDGGVDLVLTRGIERTLVQCKQWRAQRVGVSVVRELYGVMAANGAAAGIVVTSGRFTPDATEFASGRNVRLIEGPELHSLILATRLSPAAVEESFSAQTSSESEVPRCPRCGGHMVKREARRGANAGQAFWGCGQFPVCRGTPGACGSTAFRISADRSEHTKADDVYS